MNSTGVAESAARASCSRVKERLRGASATSPSTSRVEAGGHLVDDLVVVGEQVVLVRLGALGQHTALGAPDHSDPPTDGLTSPRRPAALAAPAAPVTAMPPSTISATVAAPAPAAAASDALVGKMFLMSLARPASPPDGSGALAHDGRDYGACSIGAVQVDPTDATCSTRRCLPPLFAGLAGATVCGTVGFEATLAGSDRPSVVGHATHDTAEQRQFLGGLGQVVDGLGQDRQVLVGRDLFRGPDAERVADQAVDRAQEVVEQDADLRQRELRNGDLRRDRRHGSRAGGGGGGTGAQGRDGRRRHDHGRQSASGSGTDCHGGASSEQLTRFACTQLTLRRTRPDSRPELNGP